MLGRLPNVSQQWSQGSESMSLSPEAYLFVLRCIEHELNGAVRVRSEQGQLGDWQRNLVSRQLLPGVQLHAYECIITLS